MMQRLKDFKKGIAGRIVTHLFAFGIIPLGVVGLLFLFFFYKSQKQDIITLQQEISQRIAANVSTYISESVSQIQIFAGMLDLREKNTEHLRHLCNSLLDRVSTYDSITVADAAGNEAVKVSSYYTYRPFEMENIADQKGFQRAIWNRKTHIGEVGISRYSRFPTMKITAPVNDYRERITGAVIVEVNILRIWKLIAKDRIGENRYAYIIDPAGKLIAYQEISSVLEKKDLSGIRGVREFLSGKSGVFQYRGIKEKTVIGAVQKIPPIGWGVVVELPVQNAYQNLHLLSGFFLLVLMTTTGAAIFLGLKFSYQSIVRPIRHLQKEARIIEGGQLSRRIELDREDELGQLARSFNQMVANLQRITVFRNELLGEIEERKRTETELRESENRYRTIFENAPMGIMRFDSTGTILQCNEPFAQIIGATRNGLIGFDMLKNMEPGPARQAVADAIETGIGHFEGPYRSVTGGKEMVIKANHKCIRKEKDRFVEWISIFEDITERQRLEQQFRQAQKMEAVGTLAGGIAHDFNNLLMGIMGNASLILNRIAPDDPIAKKIRIIENMVERGSALTRQLLGFARGGKYEVAVEDINGLIREHNEIFGRTRKEITITEDFCENLWPAEVDRGQFGQVLMNLYINAWQAMPGGGTLFVRTEKVNLDSGYVQPFTVKPGRYIKITVTDTGTGIDVENQQKIFEPFFTTKGIGIGTGLGLASVYGIMKNHEGFINVYSKKGCGTTFTLYFPASERNIMSENLQLSGEIRTGTGTILLVDDEEMIAEVGAEMLQALGYEVLTGFNGKEALQIFDEHQEKIDLVILDMIMPDMSGGEVFDHLKKKDESIKVMLSSGYSVNGQAQDILDRGCNGFIQKPFTLEDLSKKVGEILAS